MSVVLKPNEALSHGRIMRIRSEESQTIQKQIEEFFSRDGYIKEIPPGVSGEKARKGFNNHAVDG